MKEATRKSQESPAGSGGDVRSFPLHVFSSLSDNRKFVQEVVMAIAAVTQVEITVIDKNLVRVAGTGRYAAELDSQLPPNCISDQILRAGKAIVLEEPRKDPLCAQCAFKGQCRELAEISFPITLEGAAVGNVALVAFTEKQRGHLLANRDIYIAFLTKMSNLVSIKLEASNRAKHVELLKQHLETLVDKIEQGIIYVSPGFKVLFFNKIARDFLGPDLAVGVPMSKVLPELSWNRLEPGEQLVNREHEAINVSIKTIDELGALVEVQRISTIQQKEHEIRRRMNPKRHLAHATFGDLIGNHPDYAASVETARRYSRVDATVLITAETGTGKELFAQSIHNLSKRRVEPFVAINCAALPESLLESELFGYVGGAFTGARRGGKMGLFEQAHRGTILLDEIAEMPFRLQSSLLRVLQNKEVMRIGDDKLIPVDVRIIAATNKDLRELVEKGEFREDLYYRLNILRLNIPPLRDRIDDMPLLVQHFAIQTCRKYERQPVAFTKDCMELMGKHRWPGNIRELYNAVQRAVLLTDDALVDHDLMAEILEFHHDNVESDTVKVELDLDGSFKKIQKQIIEQLLEHLGSEDEVSRITGLSKTTIWRRLHSK
ncbi:MAG TPA: sigma 54-interacting transcriptional regulator [Acidobacteriota bacterium]|nr:sigma 54-interacting transcriptional regulator [Acidobacteriota bacterium]